MDIIINLIEIEENIKNCLKNLEAAKECKINCEKAIYDSEQLLIMYKNQLKYIKNENR